MTTFDNSIAQRHAIYTVHGERCYQCRCPIDLLTFEVDHVIPESLLTDAVRLSSVLQDLGRSSTFDVRSLENILPSCRPCNRAKSNLVWEPSLLVQRALQQAKDKLPAVVELATKLLSAKGIANALLVLERARVEGIFTKEHLEALRPLIEYQFGLRASDLQGEPVKVAHRLLLPAALGTDGERLTTLDLEPVLLMLGPAGLHVQGSNVCGCCGSRFFRGNQCVECGHLER